MTWDKLSALFGSLNPRLRSNQKRLARACKPPVRQRSTDHDTFLLRRYSADDDNEAVLAGRLATGDPADHSEEETIAALEALSEGLDEAVAGDVISWQR